jgi:16S rRNA (cytosine967-C5)-methyltransferase
MARPHPARKLSIHVLRQIEQRRGFSNRLLSDALDSAKLERRDRALATNLVYGVLRQRARLDALIDALAHNPKHLRGRTREILRVAVFELRELDRPPHVALSQAAAAIRMIDTRGPLARVVHAVLSGIVRRGEELDDAFEHGEPLTALTQRWSIPRWLGQRWLEELGAEQALERARALSRPCGIDLRVDISQTTRAHVLEILQQDDPRLKVEEQRDDDQPQLLRLHAGGRLAAHPLHRDGLFSIQALGSQQAVRALDPQPGERVLDACAGMGTKTLQIAEHLARRGTIVIVDSSAERLEQHSVLRARGQLNAAVDAGALTLETVLADMSADEPIAGVDDGARFDRVLLDAPCTGLGNLARHPEARWTAQPGDIEVCARLQRQLLARCFDRVRPGGRLVYAVCSLEPEEGRALIERFTSARADAELLTERAWTPERDACDGFYLAALTRAPDERA